MSHNIHVSYSQVGTVSADQRRLNIAIGCVVARHGMLWHRRIVLP